MKVVKNKVAPPFKQAEFDIIYGEGISKYGDLLDQAVTLNLIEKAGSWYSHGEDKIGQGAESAVQFLKDNPKITNGIARQVYAALGLRREAPQTATPETTPNPDTAKAVIAASKAKQLDSDNGKSRLKA